MYFVTELGRRTIWSAAVLRNTHWGVVVRGAPDYLRLNDVRIDEHTRILTDKNNMRRLIYAKIYQGKMDLLEFLRNPETSC